MEESVVQERAGEDQKIEGRGVGLRQAMPESARLVDQLRELFGRQWVDDALRRGIALQREHARIASLRGAAAANAWLRVQRVTGPSLRLLEAGRQVGELPERARP